MFDLDGRQNLHPMLDSPGGIARRQCGCPVSAGSLQKADVIAPNQAKSAATLLAMGAHRIMMGN